VVDDDKVVVLFFFLVDNDMPGVDFVFALCRRKTLFVVLSLLNFVVVVVVKISRRVLIQYPLTPAPRNRSRSPCSESTLTNPVLIGLIEIQTIPLLPCQTTDTPGPWPFPPQLQKVKVTFLPPSCTCTLTIHATITTNDFPGANKMPIICNI
jgi:hypothetical protein